MANQTKNFISVVALGRQNPQILNVDWLINNGIISEKQPPFDDLFKEGRKLTNFLSTPPFTSLVLGPLEFIVDEQRFQIRDNSVAEWKDTIIFGIVQRYFEVLKHTPLQTVGVNLSYKIEFDNLDEAKKFQFLFLPNGIKIAEVIGTDDINATVDLRYPSPEEGVRAALSIGRFNEEENIRIINCNYEFDFTDWANFKEELEKMPTRAISSDSIISDLLKAI